MFDSECAEIDAFLGSYKTVRGIMPEWNQRFARDWQVRWAIVDQLDIERGELCLSVDHRHENPSICCIVKQRLIHRLDVVPLTECKDNPYGAIKLGLPAKVCGPHVHGWSENREYVRENGFGRLPHRRYIEGSVVTLTDALAWVASDLGITISPGQRVTHLPPERGLL